MQKVVKFLESYIQWVALGLGLLWIGWVAYAYWLSTPVAVEIEGAKLPPGEVDIYMEKEGQPVATLNKALKNGLKVPPEVNKLFEGNGPQYADAFNAAV